MDTGFYAVSEVKSVLQAVCSLRIVAVDYSATLLKAVDPITGCEFLADFSLVSESRPPDFALGSVWTFVGSFKCDTRQECMKVQIARCANELDFGLYAKAIRSRQSVGLHYRPSVFMNLMRV